MSYHLTDIHKGRLVALKEAGYSNKDCAIQLGRSKKSVAKWWKRYQEEGDAGLAQKKNNWSPTVYEPGRGQRHCGGKFTFVMKHNSLEHSPRSLGGK